MIPIDVKSIVGKYKNTLKQFISLNELDPTLAIIQVGDNPASSAYIKGKEKDAEELGINTILLKFDEKVGSKEIVDTIKRLNEDEEVNGIIVQLPLPKYFDEETITNSIAPEKDVDGFTRDTDFTPCTPLGILELLLELGVILEGKNAVVIGRSKIVGKPMADLLLKQDMTVTICHSKTPREELKRYCKNADVIVCAVGGKNFFTPDLLGTNQIIVDVGINRNKEGKLCGDLDPLCYEFANSSQYTPVPGGVGLLTRYALMQNLCMTALNQKLTSEDFCGIIK